MSQPTAAAGPATGKRIPKLAYRNPVPADPTSTPQPSTSDSNACCSGALPVSPSQSSPSLSPSISSPVFPSSSTSQPQSPTTTSLTSVSDATHSTTLPSPKKAQAPKKKKSNAMFSFFSLKEPSQSAFEQYAKQQRKEAAEKGGKKPHNLAGITSQKLPATVPKVNSKWDGIPETMKAKDGEKKHRRGRSSISSSKVSSSSAPMSSQSSSKGSGSTRKAASSLASGKSEEPGNGSAGYDWPDFTNSKNEKRPLAELYAASPSMSTLPEMTYFFPDDPGPSNSLPGPSKASKLTLSTTEATAKSSIRLVPPSPLPLTIPSAPASPSAIFPIQEPSSPYSPSQPPPPVLQRPPTDPTSPATSRPLTPNFSRPLSARLSKLELDNLNFSSSLPANSRPGSRSSPNRVSLVENHDANSALCFTDYTHSTMTTTTATTATTTATTVTSTSITNDARHSSPLYSPPPSAKKMVDTDTISVAPSMAPSFVPSELSDDWFKDPRERLGLGGKLRRNEGMGWDERKEKDAEGKRKKKLGVVWSRGG